MIRTKLAKKVLGKKQQRHLTEMRINSMREFKESRDKLARLRKQNDNDPWYRCYECEEIERKLGVK